MLIFNDIYISFYDVLVACIRAHVQNFSPKTFFPPQNKTIPAEEAITIQLFIDLISAFIIPQWSREGLNPTERIWNWR